MEKNCFGCSFSERIPLSNRYRCKKFDKILLKFPPEPCEECIKGEVAVVEKVEEVKEIKVEEKPKVMEEKKTFVTKVEESKPTSLYEQRRAAIEKALREKRNIK